MLKLLYGRHWPAGKNKAGAKATDYIDEVTTCMGLMPHTLVAHCSDGLCNIVPLSPLPDGKECRDIFGFGPIRNIFPVSVQDAY